MLKVRQTPIFQSSRVDHVLTLKHTTEEIEMIKRMKTIFGDRDPSMKWKNYIPFKKHIGKFIGRKVDN